MSKRISLIEGIERDQTVLDPRVASEFIRQRNLNPKTDLNSVVEKTRVVDSSDFDDSKDLPLKRKIKGAVIAPSPIPIHVRVRPELASALKAASLDREMKGIYPFTQKDIVEEALEPWLKENGFLA